MDEPDTYADADIVILGAPFDGGTSHRPGTRFGPQHIRQTCYLPHDGSRPSLALRVDGLSSDLTVYDAGDVEMFSGDAERSVRDLQRAVHTVTATGAVPLVLVGDHTIAWPDAAGVAQHLGQGRISADRAPTPRRRPPDRLRAAGRRRGLVEVSPPYDHADITSALANRVVLEVLSGMARRRRDATDGSTWDPLRPLLDGR